MAQKQRILIIEDNEENLELMVFILTYAGYDCMTAVDGAQGLQLIKQEKFDLIVCDIHLPIMSGFEIIEHIKKTNHLKGVPIIAVTAYSMTGDKEKILSAGFNGYIAKPIEATLFANQIKEFLK